MFPLRPTSGPSSRCAVATIAFVLASSAPTTSNQATPFFAWPLEAQQDARETTTSANFDLAARWAPYKIRDMVHSTTVAPRWIEGSEKFWYEWENADGKFY